MSDQLLDKYMYDVFFFVSEMARLSGSWFYWLLFGLPVAVFVAMAVYCKVQKVRFWRQGFYFQVLVPIFVFIIVPFVNIAEMKNHIQAMHILNFMQEEAEENDLKFRGQYQDWIEIGQNEMLDVRRSVVNNMVDNIMSADQQGFALDLARLCLKSPDGDDLIAYLEVYPADKYEARQLFREYSQSVNYEMSNDDGRCRFTEIWQLLDRT